MKPLLNKTTKPFIIYVLVVLAISVPVYYYMVDSIWQAELDEHNTIIADKTAYELNRLNLSNEKLQSSIELWNSIQPGTNIQNIQRGANLKDSTYTIDKQRTYSAHESLDRFRCLSTIITVNGTPYRFTVETNIEETRETVAVIAAITIFFFIIIVIGFLMLTRRLSTTIWKPFHNTLDKLKTFNLNNHTKIEFGITNTKEFEELNQSLKKLIAQNVSVYKTQKEFTENASHELQTPLAVLRNKIDILLQSDDLTERQYYIAEEMNNALTRSSRINKNLLLLAKIENSQFDNSELIGFDTLVVQSMDGLEEHFKEKHINAGSSIQSGVEVKGNTSLTEVLINNLIINAIRHTSPGGAIRVVLSKSSFEVRNSGGQALDTDLLFKRFSRMSADNSGSGLGLSIVQEISRLHGWVVKYNFENNEHIFSITF